MSKRQKEMARAQWQKDKLARKAQRARDKEDGVVSDDPEQAAMDLAAEQGIDGATGLPLSPEAAAAFAASRAPVTPASPTPEAALSEAVTVATAKA